MAGMTRGQALVETVLMLPVLLALVLGGAEVGNLGIARLAWQSSAQAFADYAALNPDPVPSWQAAELARVNCDGSPVVTFPDDDRVVVDLTCQYHGLAVGAFADLPVSVAAVAIVR